MQQRAIRADALERLLEFGREAFDHPGGVVLYFDNAARRHLARAAPDAKDLERLAPCYVVLSPADEVMTVSHRYRRIARVKYAESRFRSSATEIPGLMIDSSANNPPITWQKSIFASWNRYTARPVAACTRLGR